MIVTCEKCAARYKLDDAKVTSRGAKITCPKCRHVFVVFREEEPANTPKVAGPPQTTVAAAPAGLRPPPQPAMAAPAPPPPPTRDVYSLDFRKVGIGSWKVKVRIGLIYDFSDYKTLRKYIQDGRVTTADTLSHDGKTWTPIGDIPDLERYFIDVYERAEAKKEAEEKARPAGDNPFADESPTSVAGMSDVAASNLAFNLAQAAPDPTPSGPIGTGGRSATATLPPRSSPVGGSRTLPGLDDNRRSSSSSGSASRTLPGLDDGRRGGPRTLPPSTNGRAAAPNAPARPALSPTGVAGLLVLVSIFGAWVYLNFFSTPDEDAEQPAVTVAPEPTPAPAPAEDIREKVRKELQAEIQQGTAETPPPIVEREPQLIPVKPKNLGSQTSSSLATLPSSSTSTPTVSAGTATTAPASARDHADVGDDAWRRGDYPGAVAAYREAVRLEPSSAVYQGKLGRAAYRAGDSTTAASSLSTALRGGYKEASKWLGHIARDQGDVAGAIGHYNDYLKTSPSDAAEIQREIDQLTGG